MVGDGRQGCSWGSRDQATLEGCKEERGRSPQWRKQGEGKWVRLEEQVKPEVRSCLRVPSRMLLGAFVSQWVVWSPRSPQHSVLGPLATSPPLEPRPHWGKPVFRQKRLTRRLFVYLGLERWVGFLYKVHSRHFRCHG